MDESEEDLPCEFLSAKLRAVWCLRMSWVLIPTNRLSRLNPMVQLISMYLQPFLRAKLRPSATIMINNHELDEPDKTLTLWRLPSFFTTLALSRSILFATSTMGGGISCLMDLIWLMRLRA